MRGNERLPQTNSDRIDGFFKTKADTLKTFPPRVVADNLIGQIELQLTSADEVSID